MQKTTDESYVLIEHDLEDNNKDKMSRTGQVRTKNIIEYGSCGQLYPEDYEVIIDAYNEFNNDEIYIDCVADEAQWEFYIKYVEKLIEFFDKMSDSELEDFIEVAYLSQTQDEVKQFVTDMKNWLEDGKQTGQNYIIIDWF